MINPINYLAGSIMNEKLDQKNSSIQGPRNRSGRKPPRKIYPTLNTRSPAYRGNVKTAHRRAHGQGGVQRTTKPLRLKSFQNGEEAYARVLTTDLVEVYIHSHVPDGRGNMLDVPCNDDTSDCLLCIAGFGRERTYFLPMFFLQEEEVLVVRFLQGGISSALGPQLLRLAARDDVLHRLVRIHQSGHIFHVSFVRERETKRVERALGKSLDDISRPPCPRREKIEALLEPRSSSQLLRESHWIGPKLKWMYPGTHFC